ncbi:hypothetical protein [Streptomyces sp. NPDC001948]
MIENQFIAERARRDLISTGRQQIWWGNSGLSAVERQLRRILLRLTSHLRRQPQDLQENPDAVGNPLWSVTDLEIQGP